MLIPADPKLLTAKLIHGMRASLKLFDAFCYCSTPEAATLNGFSVAILRRFRKRSTSEESFRVADL
jgi:hypothetical protein